MKILLAVKSCWKHEPRRQAVRETWLPEAHCLFDVKFFVGDHEPLKPFAGRTQMLTQEKDVVVVPWNDDFKNIGPKIATASMVGVQDGYDRVVIVDDDTYIQPTRLWTVASWIEDNEVLAYMRPEYPQGACYAMGKKAFNIIAGAPTMWEPGPDDLAVGRALRIYPGIDCIHTEAFNPGPNWRAAYPLRDNHVIATHKCLPADMKIVHQEWLRSHGAHV